MKGISIILLLGLGGFLGQRCNAQYTKRQIDSIYNVADRSHDTELCLKLGDLMYDASKKIGYEEGMIRACTISGIKCYDVFRWEDAFRYATKGEALAIKLHDKPNMAVLGIIKGTSYTYLGFYADGKQALLSAILPARQIADTDTRHFRLGNIYFSLGLNNEMSGGNLRNTLAFRQKSYDEQLQISSKSKYVIRLSTAVVNMGDIYFKLKQYDSAAYFLNKALGLATAHDIYNLHAKGLASIDFGELCYLQRKFNASERYYQNALKAYTELKNAYHIRDVCTGLSKVYIALDEPGKAKMYLDRSIQLSDSIARAEKAAIKTPLGYLSKKDATRLSADKHNYDRIILIMSALLAVMLISFILYQRRYKSALSASAHATTAFVRGDMAGQHFPAPSKSEQLKEIVDLAMNNNPAFLVRYNEFDANFGKKLLQMAPHLVATEIEFCVLLRLNFETKEIARYTKTSVRSVEGKKYRIRKKLSIPSDQDITVWMTNM